MNLFTSGLSLSINISQTHRSRLAPLCSVLLATLLIFSASVSHSQERSFDSTIFAGSWVINEELSDNTDRRVEAALRASGERVKTSWFRRTRDKYRGGPPEQELYDHISYDLTLNISLEESEFHFLYDDGFLRPVYTDNRSQSVSLNALAEVEDFSFAHWEDDKLYVEARPRDGGFSQETYTLTNGGNQLRVEFYIQPKVFFEPIELVRVYDRAL